MKVWVAHVTTNGGDHYYYAFDKKPTVKAVAKIVWSYEGECEDLSYYEDSLSIDIEQLEVIKSKK